MTLRQLELQVPFLIHYSDIILPAQSGRLKRLVEFHQFQRVHDKNVIGTLMASNRYRVSVGRIIPDKDPSFIKRFDEKPSDSQPLGYQTNMAVSVFEPEFLRYCEEEHESLYGDSVKNAARHKKKFCLYPQDEWNHIQTLSDWLDVQRAYFPGDVKFWRG
jgi:NDP-sugar pyrophosphorylase family protein